LKCDGVIPAHLSTLRLGSSRHQLHVTGTYIITDPHLAPLGRSYPVDVTSVSLKRATFTNISGGAASTYTPYWTVPAHGV
jgi:hypothetical protein